MNKYRVIILLIGLIINPLVQAAYSNKKFDEACEKLSFLSQKEECRTLFNQIYFFDQQIEVLCQEAVETNPQIIFSCLKGTMNKEYTVDEVAECQKRFNMINVIECLSGRGRSFNRNILNRVELKEKLKGVKKNLDKGNVQEASGALNQIIEEL